MADDWDDSELDEDDDDRISYCSVCEGDAERGYDDCEFRGMPDVYEPGPGSQEKPGCPRMTGTF